MTTHLMGPRVLARWLLISAALVSTQVAHAQTALSPIEQFGKFVFFDDHLSEPTGQSCASCHDPAVGWTGAKSPDQRSAVVAGAVGERFGNRKPPSSAYATFSPVRVGRVGGNFWDGRATGTFIAATNVVPPDHEFARYLGPAADQAMGPFENSLEQNTDRVTVCRRVSRSSYAAMYARAWGMPMDCSALPGGVDVTYMRLAVSIAAYEASDDVNSFTSRFDAGALSRAELEGFELFRGKGQCAGCHTVAEGVTPGDGSQTLFTGFRTFNIGVPRNRDNPYYRMDRVRDGEGNVINPAGYAFIDVGDGEGRFKTPTLRNVDKRPRPSFVRTYTHNGYFTKLEDIVHFYNTRDIKPRCTIDLTTVRDALRQGCWPAPEIGVGLAGDGVDPADPGVGDLGLSALEEAKIVAFLRTLSDRHTASPPPSKPWWFDKPWERPHDHSRR
jgi:cytochrome c peroxidase